MCTYICYFRWFKLHFLTTKMVIFRVNVPDFPTTHSVSVNGFWLWAMQLLEEVKGTVHLLHTQCWILFVDTALDSNRCRLHHRDLLRNHVTVPRSPTNAYIMQSRQCYWCYVNLAFRSKTLTTLSLVSFVYENDFQEFAIVWCTSLEY